MVFIVSAGLALVDDTILGLTGGLEVSRQWDPVGLGPVACCHHVILCGKLAEALEPKPARKRLCLYLLLLLLLLLCCVDYCCCGLVDLVVGCRRAIDARCYRGAVM